MKFTIKIGNTNPNIHPYNPPDVVEAKNRIREADNWEDIPLAAVPVIEEGWPQMPDYMDGRQYFLWMKNGFKTDKNGDPSIFNPLPERDNVTYVMAGGSSRRWGA